MSINQNKEMLGMLGAKEDFEVCHKMTYEGVEIKIQGITPHGFIFADGIMQLETFKSFHDKTLEDIGMSKEERFATAKVLYQSRVKAIRTAFEDICNSVGEDYQKELQALEEQIFEIEQKVDSKGYDYKKTRKELEELLKN